MSSKHVLNFPLQSVLALNLHQCVHMTSYCYLVFSSFRWKLNGTSIDPTIGSRYTLFGGNLRISQLNKDQDSGIYQCFASNSFGTIVSRKASLTFACRLHALSLLSLLVLAFQGFWGHNGCVVYVSSEYNIKCSKAN